MTDSELAQWILDNMHEPSGYPDGSVIWRLRMGDDKIEQIVRSLRHKDGDPTRALIDAVQKFCNEGTMITACNRGPCHRVIEHEDKSDPQYKMLQALKAYHDAAHAPQQRPDEPR